MIDPYRLNFTLYHCEIKYSQASGFLGSPQVITLIIKVGQQYRVWWPWGTCHVGCAVSLREGISKIDIVNTHH